jgi:Protein of unknown function (DUF3298)/Deacetylase PdaC
MTTIIFIIISFFYSISALADHQMAVINKSTTERNKIPKFNVEVKYPQINSRLDSNSQRDFNTLVKKTVETNISNFKTTVRENEKYPLPSKIKANGNFLKINYMVAQLGPRIISLRYVIDTYYTGAAHPDRKYEAINYDLISNKQIFLPDFFKTNSKYLRTISTYSEKQLRSKLKKDFFKQGVSPKLKNFTVWNITHKGLKFTFDSSQVAPHSYGAQEVVIPYSIIKNEISSQYAEMRGTELYRSAKTWNATNGTPKQSSNMKKI